MIRKGLLQAFRILSQSRVKAGVLQLTLGIGLVISMICASMIFLVYYNKVVFLQQRIEDRLRENARSGIQYAIATRESLTFNSPQVVDLYGDEADSVEIIRRPWGVFEAIVAKAWQGNHVQHKTALITAQPDEHGKAVIYTPDNNAPLYLVGKTSIVGTAYLSERKLSTGYIDGKDYKGKTLIQGTIKKSEPTILKIDTALLREVKNIVKEKNTKYQLRMLDHLPIRTELTFQSPESNYYFTNSSIDLSDSLSGNLIIHSAIKVRVTSDAKLSDIILIAPDIDIDNGFEGSIQCFAERTITVGKESKLHYPSALVLMGEERDSTIVIREDASVTGLVVIPGYDQSISSRGYLKIEKNAVLHGQAYINAAADIQGSLWGHIMAKSFTVKISSSEYNSHILDGEINSEKRSPHLPGSLLWAHTKELVVAKWLK